MKQATFTGVCCFKLGFHHWFQLLQALWHWILHNEPPPNLDTLRPPPLRAVMCLQHLTTEPSLESGNVVKHSETW